MWRIWVFRREGTGGWGCVMWLPGSYEQMSTQAVGSIKNRPEKPLLPRLALVYQWAYLIEIAHGSIGERLQGCKWRERTMPEEAIIQKICIPGASTQPEGSCTRESAVLSSCLTVFINVWGGFHKSCNFHEFPEPCKFIMPWSATSLSVSTQWECFKSEEVVTSQVEIMVEHEYIPWNLSIFT